MSFFFPSRFWVQWVRSEENKEPGGECPRPESDPLASSFAIISPTCREPNRGQRCGCPGNSRRSCLQLQLFTGCPAPLAAQPCSSQTARSPSGFATLALSNLQSGLEFPSPVAQQSFPVFQQSSLGARSSLLAPVPFCAL